MELTEAASLLNEFFYGFDSLVLNFYHGAASVMGSFLTPLMVFISYFGVKGIFSIVLSIILILFADTRKEGITALLAIGIGAILCNVIIKPTVARPRPYTISPYDQWWQDVGAHAEKDMSFPSGHVNVIAASFGGIFLASERKRFTWTLFIGVVLMGISRNYLMVHYPSDVLFGMITGFVSAALSFAATHYIYRAIVGRKDNKICRWIIEADLLKAVKKGKNK